MRDEQDRKRKEVRPEKIFRALRDRPAPELDHGAAWTRLQARLEDPRRGPGARLRELLLGEARPVLRWLPAGLAVVVMAVGWWTVAPPRGGQDIVVDQPEPLRSVGASAEDQPRDDALVLLADAETAREAVDLPAPAVPIEIEARVIRGYTGTLPTDALPVESSGAGGADPLADLRPTLAGVVPASDYALVGQWRGMIDPGAIEVAVSDRYRLSYRVQRTATGLRLLDVRLLGEETPLIAEAIDLEPGRLYVFGAGDPETELVLALRIAAMATGAEVGPEPEQE
jgi:hypothetical protein